MVHVELCYGPLLAELHGRLSLPGALGALAGMLTAMYGLGRLLAHRRRQASSEQARIR